MLPFVIGLGVTVIGAATIVGLLFAHRREPAASGIVIEGVTISPVKVSAPRPAANPTPAPVSGEAIRVGWAVRLRAAVLLALVTLGVAALVSTLLGAAVLAIGVLIQH